MKKMIFCIIAILMAVISCTSSGTPITSTNTVSAVVTDGQSTGMDMDAAIKAAALKMGTSLPAKTEVALVNLASTSVQLSEYIISRLEAALVDNGKLIVLDRANLDRIREEQGFQLSGEVDDNSAKDIGKMLGAGAIVTGSFINLGDVYGLSLKAINMKTAAIAMSYPADITKNTRIETLLASGGGSAGNGTQTAQTLRASGNSTTVPVQSTASFPRIGRWRITGKDGVIWDGSLMIIEEINGENFSGHFDWDSRLDSRVNSSGKEYFRGEYSKDFHRVTIRGYRLADANGIGLGNYQAYLTSNGYDFESGTWSGGTWTAKWLE